MTEFLSIIQKIPFSTWQTEIDRLLEKYEVDNPDLVAEVVAAINKYDDDIRIRYFILKAEEIMVISRHENAAAGTSMVHYCRECLDFCKKFEDDTDVDWSDFERQKRFSEKFIACVDQDGGYDRPEFSHDVETCLGIYEPFDAVVDEIMGMGFRSPSRPMAQV